MKWLLTLTACCAFPTSLMAEEPLAKLGQALTFHASFDISPKADFAKGDPRIYTSEDLSRKKLQPGLHAPGVSIEPAKGRHGDALRFTQKTKQVVMYQAAGNMPYKKRGFQGTVSFWMSLDPNKDLEPGFVDPIQITDKTWNKSSFFIDFTKDDNPRHVRLGVFSDYDFWNPKNRKWDDIPPAERPMVDVADPPFGRDQWTHVAWTFSRFNEGDQEAACQFYLNGKLQGSIKGPQRFTWQLDRTAIMLGIYYIGRMDDLAIFDRALTAEEIVTVSKLEDGIKSLGR